MKLKLILRGTQWGQDWISSWSAKVAAIRYTMMRDIYNKKPELFFFLSFFLSLSIHLPLNVTYCNLPWKNNTVYLNIFLVEILPKGISFPTSRLIISSYILCAKFDIYNFESSAKQWQF